MRGAFIGGLLLFLAFIASGQEPPGTVTLLDGGFAPSGTGFRVTFEFSDMQAAAGSAKQGPHGMSAPGLIAPAVEWSSAHGAAAQLEMGCVKKQAGLGDVTLALARLRLTNPTDRPFKTTLAVAIAPQSAIHALAFDRHAFFVEGRPVLVAETPSRGAILADSPFASRPLTPQDRAHVESAKGECRGEMLYDLTLMPGQTQTLGFICPVPLPKATELDLDFYRTLSVDDLFEQARKDAAGR
jgi:hypothetical protein